MREWDIERKYTTAEKIMVSGTFKMHDVEQR